MYKIISSESYAQDEVAKAAGKDRMITAVCDTAADMTALGTDWFPLSVAIICSPFSVKIMNASGEWKDK